eukprot:GHVU01051399.1.p1 GENE.GHVU01051399.1~~GHVU01051399.1.p1  ORF type:complete len:320 (-),score=40.42 GHVU01051399.1:109-1068(-)
MLYICKICDFSSCKKFSTIRHLKNVHKEEDNHEDYIIIDNQVTNDLQLKKDTKISFRENLEDVRIIPNKEFTDNDYKYIKDKKYKCDKCNKKYNTLEYYKNHIKDCNKSYQIDNLTCPKCMKSFYSKDSKNRHIRNNKCKPCSINNPINPIDNTVTNSYNTNSYNTNNTNNIVNNIYNNYNNERTDYITLEKVYDIIIKTLPICDYTLYKHFNTNFTENNNIRYSSKNKCFVRENNKWSLKNLNTFLKAHIDNTSFELRNKISANLDFINNKTKDDIITNDIYFSLNNKHFTNRYYKDNIDTIKDYICNSTELENKDSL